MEEEPQMQCGDVKALSPDLRQYGCVLTLVQIVA